MNKSTLPFLAAATVASFALSACVTERIVESDPIDTSVSTTRTVTYEPGYTTNTLPSGYTTRTISDRQYYVADDVYYTRGPSGGYTVVSAPDVTTSATVNPTGSGYVSTLPSGYTTRSYRGTDYYYSGGQYYRKDPRGYTVTPNPF